MSVPTLPCPNCGAHWPTGAAVCPNCGYMALRVLPPESPTTPPPEPPLTWTGWVAMALGAAASLCAYSLTAALTFGHVPRVPGRPIYALGFLAPSALSFVLRFFPPTQRLSIGLSVPVALILLVPLLLFAGIVALFGLGWLAICTMKR